MNTGISPGAKWFTLCLPFFQYLFFHCKFTISISVSVCRCKSKVAQSSEIFRRFNNTILTLPLFSLFREIVVNMRTETEYMIYIICRYAPMLYICAKIVDWKRENGENGGKNEFFGKKLPEDLWIQKIAVPLQRFRKQTGV